MGILFDATKNLFKRQGREIVKNEDPQAPEPTKELE